MPQVRDKTMQIRLTADEEWVRDELARQYGTDGASVMRQAFLKMARKEGIHLPSSPAQLKKKGPLPK